MQHAKSTHDRKGTSILELLFSLSIMSTILMSVFAIIQRDTSLAQSTLGISLAETKAQQMLRKIETELADARGANPIARLTAPLEEGNSMELSVDSTLGFPDQGILLLERGSQNEERLLYESNSLSDNSFTSLFRGKQCTVDVSHAAHTELIWAGLAEVVSLGPDSGASDYDGLATGYRGDMFFRGDGYGFSYRVPIDPTQSVPPNYLGSDDQLQWGHVLRQPDGSEAPDLGAWACLYFVPKFTFSESTSGDDVNRDGDTTDIFDVGQIRRRIWSTNDPNKAASELGMGPSNILQERCEWGSDLNGDGFEDPIFLWDRGSRRLQISLFILGRTNADQPIVRQVQSVLFLRNIPES
ncbi:MAG: hypothetical protein ABGY71_00455 [bacterium]|nr:hypothetical protein [Planctomycetota bacterium]HIL52857.1 hypothetical protein [Planctomycetota bacterium]